MEPIRSRNTKKHKTNGWMKLNNHRLNFTQFCHDKITICIKYFIYPSILNSNIRRKRTFSKKIGRWYEPHIAAMPSSVITNIHNIVMADIQLIITLNPLYNTINTIYNNTVMKYWVVGAGVKVQQDP